MIIGKFRCELVQTLLNFLNAQRHTLVLLLVVASILVLGKGLPEEPLRMLFDSANQSSIPHSIFNPGFHYWFYVIFTLEAVIFLIPNLQTTRLVSHGHANPFNTWVIAFVVLITFVSSWLSWSEIRRFEITPDDLQYRPFFSAIILSSGAALLIHLGYLLNLRWRGYGFWLLYFLYFVTSSFSDLYQWITDLPAGQNQYVFAKVLALTIIVYVCATLLVIVRKTAAKNDNQSLFFLWLFVSVASFLISHGWGQLINSAGECG
jgi:hypothetical protein